MRMLMAVLMAGCSGATIEHTPDATVAQPQLSAAIVEACGAMPEQPEIPSILDTTDENGKAVVVIDRPFFTQITDYEYAIRQWSYCLKSH